MMSGEWRDRRMEGGLSGMEDEGSIVEVIIGGGVDGGMAEDDDNVGTSRL